MFIITAVLMVISLTLGVSSWLRLNEIAAQKVEQDQILDNYADMREQINLRLGLRQDGQSFITPDEPEISAKVQEITGGYAEGELWHDYSRLFQWVMRNVEYSLDSPTPLLPPSAGGTLE